jgi:flagellar biosynthesis protein FlhG
MPLLAPSLTSAPERTVDQASRLRQLTRGIRPMATAAADPLLPALAVTGGKGGVGKTCVAVNLAVALARLGLRPLLIDADLGLANADILLGVDPARTLHDHFAGGVALSEVVTRTPWGIDFVPAASGHEELAALDDTRLAALTAGLARLGSAYDLLVIDTPAGIGREVMASLRASRVVLAVVTPDPTSITDAYALIKVLESQRPGKDVRILVNQARNLAEAQAVFAKLRGVAVKHLGRELAFAGELPRDPQVAEAVRRRRPFTAGQVDCPAASALRALALRLKGERWKG